MKVIKRTAESDIAKVYIGQNNDGRLFEFVESTQPPFSRNEKWVLIISTLYGCPVDCKFCDAGGKYQGKLSYDELMFQIDYLVKSRFPDGKINTAKFKIQFARMGEPAFNPAVLEVLEKLPGKYELPLFIPSVSSIAPQGTDDFFERLLKIKKQYYRGTFQLQFSIHSTDMDQRNQLMPVRKWDFEKIAEYSNRFYDEGGKKITLNFALSVDSIFDIEVLKRYFSPDIFLIKLTPLNPTYKARKNNLESLIFEGQSSHRLQEELKLAGYESILSIGEWEENKIGSNCGQFVNTFLNECGQMEDSYSYNIETI